MGRANDCDSLSSEGKNDLPGTSDSMSPAEFCDSQMSPRGDFAVTTLPLSPRHKLNEEAALLLSPEEDPRMSSSLSLLSMDEEPLLCDELIKIGLGEEQEKRRVARETALRQGKDPEERERGRAAREKRNVEPIGGGDRAARRSSPRGGAGIVWAGTGWLIRGSDTFQTSFRPVSDQCRMSDLRIPCHSVISVAQSMLSCPVRCTVMSDPRSVMSDLRSVIWDMHLS